MKNSTTLRGYQVALLGDKRIVVLRDRRGSGGTKSLCGFYWLSDLQGGCCRSVDTGWMGNSEAVVARMSICQLAEDLGL